MVARPPTRHTRSGDGRLIAVLGPTNTGKTHLAIERLCAHSSGAIGFPLRLLAREVYEKVCAIKGESQVALITGEERIEPPQARWLLCTVEAMPTDRELAFVALDEAQLCADRERGHIFADRLLHARGREETMILGSATIAPVMRDLLPEAEIISRPRFSTLRHVGAKKLSRVPPRSAIVAFSAEQVYAVAEMLRRFRGGAAVVMGALSPQTRNAQVAMYQSGEVDYLVATDAIGMGLNLDLGHVAFAGLSKFDGQRQRRLTTAEMAQIAGRAGRHQRDGTFGTLAGTRSHDAEFTDDEVFAIEEHRFPSLDKLFWRESEPRLDSLADLIDDLSATPSHRRLAPAPEAIDLAVMRRLAEDEGIAATVRGRAAVSRFREACMLPDFRQQGADVHSRFVARLWEDLRQGSLPTDYVAVRISELDLTGGDIDTLQGRIAAIRSWSYITQRPDWVIAREEMAARARAVEARLSDALHARLTERFVNRKLTVLMKNAANDAALLPVAMDGETILVAGEEIGKLEGFRFRVDPAAHHTDHKLLFAAAERHLPDLLAERARELVAALDSGEASLSLANGALLRGTEPLAAIGRGRSRLALQVQLLKSLDAIPMVERSALLGALQGWVDRRFAVLEPLTGLDQASREESGGSELRALLIRLAEAGGVLVREGSGLEALAPPQRDDLRKLGVRVGALDLYLPAMLRPAAQEAWRELRFAMGETADPVPSGMPAVVDAAGSRPPHGFRRTGKQAIRVDLAERLLRAAHERRTAAGRRMFTLDPALARSMGLTTDNHVLLLRQGGFRQRPSPVLDEAAFGPPGPPMWQWQPPQSAKGRQLPAKAAPRSGKRNGSPRGAEERASSTTESPPAGGAFGALAALIGKPG